MWGGSCSVAPSHPTWNPPAQLDPAFAPSQGLTAASVTSSVALSHSRAWRQLVALGGGCHRARGCPRGTWATPRQTVPGAGLARGVSWRFSSVCGPGDPTAPPWGLAAWRGCPRCVWGFIRPEAPPSASPHASLCLQHPLAPQHPLNTPLVQAAPTLSTSCPPAQPHPEHPLPEHPSP